MAKINHHQEPTTTVTYEELREAVGRYLGYHYDAESWSDAQSRDVKRCIKEGLSQFQTPPLLPGERTIHLWSFSQPIHFLTLDAGEWDYDLPPNFGGLQGEVSLLEDGIFSMRPEQYSVPSMLQLRSDLGTIEASSFAPRYFAIRPLPQDGTTHVRHLLMVYPRPDTKYTLQIPYYVLLDAPDDQIPFLPGTAAHASTIQAACLAAAERLLNDIARGPEYELFLERLRASVELDRRQDMGKLGQNTNREYPEGGYGYDEGGHYRNGSVGYTRGL